MESGSSQKVSIELEAKIEGYLRALDQVKRKLEATTRRLDAATLQYNNSVKRTLLGSRTAFRAFAKDIGMGTAALEALGPAQSKNAVGVRELAGAFSNLVKQGEEAEKVVKGFTLPKGLVKAGGLAGVGLAVFDELSSLVDLDAAAKQAQARSAQTAVKFAELTNQVGDYDEAIQKANLSTDDLQAVFGSNADRIGQLFEKRVPLEAEDAEKALDKLVTKFRVNLGLAFDGLQFFDENSFNSIDQKIAELRQEAKDLTLSDFSNSEAPVEPSIIDGQISLLQQQKTRTEKLRQELGLTSEATVKLIAKFGELGKVKGFDEQLAKLFDLVELLQPDAVGIEKTTAKAGALFDQLTGIVLEAGKFNGLQERRAIGIARDSAQAGSAIPTPAASAGVSPEATPTKEAIPATQRQVEALKKLLQVIFMVTGAVNKESTAIGQNTLEKQKLLTTGKAEFELRAAGIPITEEASKKIDDLTTSHHQLAAGIASTAHSEEQLSRSLASLDSIAKDALGGFINDLRNGTSAADALENALRRIEDRLIDIALNALFSSSGGGLFGSVLGGLTGGLAGFKNGGEVRGFAAGGFVTGPGGGRSDSIPAMLSNGEFVATARATRDNRPLLEAINGGAFNLKRLNGFADGGLVAEDFVARRIGNLNTSLKRPASAAAAPIVVPAPAVNQRIINAFDEDEVVSKVLDGPVGEKSVVNMVRRNPSKFRGALGL